MPSENSHTAIGSAKSADAADTCPHTSNRVAVTEAMSRAAPMNPSTGSARGARRDRYSSEPSSRAFTAGEGPCPGGEGPVGGGSQGPGGGRAAAPGPGPPEGSPPRPGSAPKRNNPPGGGGGGPTHTA